MLDTSKVSDILFFLKIKRVLFFLNVRLTITNFI